MVNKLILVVDDEAHIRRLLRMYLEQGGFRVEESPDGERALFRLERAPLPALIVLDLMLPGIDGWDVCRQVRTGPHADLPILMLTARDEDMDKIIGLELGADDYVTKPFNPREIVARVKAILRRAAPDRDRASESLPPPVTVGNIILDPARREVTVGGETVALRRKEFDLLETLARQPEIVLSRDQLLEQVWGYDVYGQTRTVDVHIAALRRKLKVSTVEIETVIGIGYRLLTPDS